MAKPTPGLNANQRAILRIAAARSGHPQAPPAGTPHPATHPAAAAKPGLFHWPTDPKGKAPAHTVPYGQHQINRAPIVPGSSINNKTLGQQSAAAVTEKYGPAETAAKQAVGDATQHQTDIGGYYDQYLAQLAQHKTNVDAANTQANAEVANLGNVTGPAPSGPVSDANATDDKNAAAVRSALLGALQGALVGQGRAASTYADTLAHVVGPGQKVVAETGAARERTKAQQDLGTVKSQEGAYRVGFEDTAKQNESKNVLAEQALGLQTAKLTSDNANAAANRKAAKTKENQALITSGPFAGLTHKQVRSMTPQDQQNLKDAAKTPEKTITSGPFAGYTQSEIGRHSPAWVQARLKASQGSTNPATANANKFYQQFGVKPASTTQVTASQGTLQRANSFARELKGSVDRATASRLLTQGGKVQVGTQGGKPVYKTYPAVPGLWLTVALDLAYNGYVSKATQDRLHKSGYLASQFNLPTRAPTLPKQPKPKPVASNPFTGSTLPIAAP